MRSNTIAAADDDVKLWLVPHETRKRPGAKAQDNLSVLTFPSLGSSGIPGRWIHYSQNV